MQPSFRTRVRQAQVLIGTILTIPAAQIAEILSQAGFDWLFVDLEHSPMGIREAELMLQAAGSGMPCVIRVPALEEAWIKKALDTGAAGIIVPNIKSGAEAERAVQLCKYPPAGIRGVGLARAHGYGPRFQEYVASANEETAVILQVEHADAVANIELLTAVPGIDCLFIGPYDLSASYGKAGLTTDPEVQEAMARVQRQADRAGIPMGIFGVSAAAVQPYIENGYTLIATGIDSLFLGEGARNCVEVLKQKQK